MATLKENIKQKEKEKIAYDYYINKGYTPEQALGIVGNLIHESGLNTTIVGDKNLKHNAYGIAQWRAERYDRLKQRYGNEWNKFENQLEFVDWELNNTHKKAGQLLKSAKSAHEAGQIFSDEFERPKLKYHQDKNRASKVASLSQRLTGYTPEMNSKETFLSDSQQLPNFAYNQTASVMLPDYATLPEPVEEKKQEEQKSSAESKLEEKQKEQDFLDYFKQNKEQLAQLYPTEQEQPRAEAPQLTALDYYNQANQILSAQQGGVIPISPNGVYDYPNQPVIVPTSGAISMKNVPYKIKATSLETGETKVLNPNLEYFFSNTKNVLEIPLTNG